MKDNNEVIQDFNSYVNMTATELTKWLKSPTSTNAGWGKEEGNAESVGHSSGRQIVEILESNPDKDPEKYTEEQVKHMRKVVAYCKRHLAQETSGNNEKGVEEVKESKSYASLKNWGHDFLRARGEEGDNDEGKKHGKEEEVAEDDVSKEDGEGEVGSKRKQTESDQAGSKKKQETSKGMATRSQDEQPESEEVTDNDNDEKEENKANKNGTNGKGKNPDAANEADEKNKKLSKGPKKGDTVSWNWGSGQPQGKVLDVKGEK